MGCGGEFWQNMVHWRREWQTISVFLPWEPHEQYEYVYIHITQLAEITLPYSKIFLVFKSNFSFVVVQLNHFWFGSASSFFLELFLCCPPVAYCTTTDLRSFFSQCHIFLHFLSVHGALKARLLKWFVIPFSSGPCFVRTLHHDPNPVWCPNSVSVAYSQKCILRLSGYTISSIKVDIDIGIL